MSRASFFAGLPAEFDPPEKAARHIAALKTIAEREACWLRIPEGWRPMIGHFVEITIAFDIVEMPEKVARQNALASVPEVWREEVKWHVVRLWHTKDLRAEYQAELAVKRAREKAAA